MCAKFAALTIFDTKSVAAWVFDQVVAIALSLNELTLWVGLKGVHHDRWSMRNTFHAYCTFLVVMAAR